MINGEYYPPKRENGSLKPFDEMGESEKERYREQKLYTKNQEQEAKKNRRRRRHKA